MSMLLLPHRPNLELRNPIALFRRESCFTSGISWFFLIHLGKLCRSYTELLLLEDLSIGRRKLALMGFK